MMLRFRPVARAARRQFSSKDGAPTTVTFEKMESDPRYKAGIKIDIDETYEGDRFSIKGAAIENVRPSYLDMQSTTPLDPRVLDAMLPHMMGSFGNPHSRTHSYGWSSEASVEEARAQISSLINCTPKEIVFTSGATESNNLAIKGVAGFYGGRKKHIITTQTEHKCVLDSCRHLEGQGFEVSYLPVEKSTGLVNLQDLANTIRKGETSLVSVMAVNNEIGTLQPLKEIGELCRSNKVFFHTDAAQMLGKMPIDVDEMKIDLMSMSSHKIYGPKGIGGLYIRRRPRVRLTELISGGGQERGMRSGTLPHPLCVGFGEACEVAGREMMRDEKHVNRLSARLEKSIKERIPEVTVNGHAGGEDGMGYPGCLNVSFAYVEGESLLMALKNVAVSSGSACTSASLEPSYVLRALGVDDELAHSSLRFGIGRFTTDEEVDFVVDLLEEHVTRLRDMSPLWEMVQEGIDLSTIQWSQDEGHDHGHGHGH
ncbi:hypothetical protein TrCOL_g4653 [Triparma columacea]|uniref:cysteine desulfurase n=1 Tax=Triparma columacea TaxID=722753 RepID=A0A9W7GKV9_9STRA|nr:hypothetical protein TrCOL_g4653 [Triparma columacea]